MKEFDYEKRVMGSEASISIVATDRDTADVTAAALFEIAENEEARFSRFREGSELSRLNRERTLKVSREFMDALLLGKDVYQKTGGVFNPLVDISRFGYDADISVVKGTERNAKEDGVYRIDMETVLIDQNSMTVSLQEGQNLDFGGFIKGYTAEKMVNASRYCQGVIVNLGGDIYANGLDIEGRPFSFEIENPASPDTDLSFFATNVGIATSGSYNRHWNLRDTSFFHILDQSGMKNPNTEILSATVIAQTGAESDALATAALVLGVEAGEKLLSQSGCEYCFIAKDGALTLSPAFPLVQKTKTLTYAK